MICELSQPIANSHTRDHSDHRDRYRRTIALLSEECKNACTNEGKFKSMVSQKCYTTNFRTINCVKN